MKVYEGKFTEQRVNDNGDAGDFEWQVGYNSLEDMFNEFRNDNIRVTIEVIEEKPAEVEEDTWPCKKCHYGECRGCSNERFNSKCGRCPCDDCKAPDYSSFREYDEN